MPKTKRELLYELADKLGAAHAERLRAALEKRTPFDDLLDRPLSDEELASQMKMMECAPEALSKIKGIDWDKPGTWGLPN